MQTYQRRKRGSSGSLRGQAQAGTARLRRDARVVQGRPSACDGPDCSHASKYDRTLRHLDRPDGLDAEHSACQERILQSRAVGQKGSAGGASCPVSRSWPDEDLSRWKTDLHPFWPGNTEKQRRAATGQFSGRRIMTTAVHWWAGRGRTAACRPIAAGCRPRRRRARRGSARQSSLLRRRCWRSNVWVGAFAGAALKGSRWRRVEGWMDVQ